MSRAKSKKTEKCASEGVTAGLDPFLLRETPYVHYGHAIESIRCKLGLNQGEFGAMLEGFSQTNIARYESGATDPPIEFWRKLTRMFGVSLSWILTGEGDPYVGGFEDSGERKRGVRFWAELYESKQNTTHRINMLLEYREVVSRGFGELPESVTEKCAHIDWDQVQEAFGTGLIDEEEFNRNREKAAGKEKAKRKAKHSK